MFLPKDHAAFEIAKLSPLWDSGSPLISIDDVEAAISHSEGDEHR